MLPYKRLSRFVGVQDHLAATKHMKSVLKPLLHEEGRQ
jgi:hypothetical protein